jgi:peptidoglycan hydrolase-like protein with peptidoglycan-binding domain
MKKFGFLGAFLSVLFLLAFFLISSKNVYAQTVPVASCYTLQPIAGIGQPVRWYASYSGGLDYLGNPSTSPYFIWSGSDINNTGTTSSIFNINYYSAGQKNMSVTYSTFYRDPVFPHSVIGISVGQDCSNTVNVATSTTPTISTLSPNPASIGSVISVIGTNFTPNENSVSVICPGGRSGATLIHSPDTRTLQFLLSPLTSTSSLLSYPLSCTVTISNTLGTSTHAAFTIASPIPPPNPCFSFAKNLQLGQRSADVAALQTFLVAKGFPISDLLVSRGSPKGYFGMATFEALKLYQASVGIPATGFAGPLTRASINSQSCNPQAAPNATITTRRNAASPEANTLTAGQRDVTLALVDFMAGGASSSPISKIEIASDSSRATSNITNIRIYDGATLIGSASGLSRGSLYAERWVNVNNLTLPLNTWKTLRVVADIASTTTRGIIRLGIVGLDFSGTRPDMSGLPIFGGLMNISPVASPASLDVTSISSDITVVNQPSIGDTAVARFRLRLDNIGGSDIFVSKIASTAYRYIVERNGEVVRDPVTTATIVAMEQNTSDTSNAFIMQAGHSRTFDFTVSMNNSQGISGQYRMKIDRIYYGTNAGNLSDMRISSGLGNLVTSYVALTGVATTTPNPAPTVTVTVSPESVSVGGQATVSWSSKNATSCSFSPEFAEKDDSAESWSGHVGPVELTGSITGPITSKATLSVICTGPGGTGTGGAVITPTQSVTSSVRGYSLSSAIWDAVNEYFEKAGAR